MKHAREDYNRIQDPENKIPKDEPVFLLRAQDQFAPELLLRWSSKLRLHYGNPKMAEMVENHAHEMLEWQRKIKCKTPDLDASDNNEDKLQAARPETPLDRPQSYGLIEIFEHLKFGRPSDDQNLLDLFISLMSNDTEELNDELVELLQERNAIIVSSFMAHCKQEGLEIPESYYMSYFKA